MQLMRMEKKLTRTDIADIANKVMELIKGEVGDNEDLIKTVLYGCETQTEIERKLK